MSADQRNELKSASCESHDRSIAVASGRGKAE